MQHVTQLPYDIDGLCKFAISCTRQDMMRFSKDGHPWKTWVTSTRKGFEGIRRVARCKGSPVCNSRECPFLKSRTGPNRSQFQVHGSCMQCFTCGTPASAVSCHAVKVLDYDKRKSSVVVMHVGIHTCRAKLPKINQTVLLKAVSQNPGVKPNKLVNDQMVQLMTTDNIDYSEVQNVAQAFVDIKRVHNARADILSLNNPLGNNFEALGAFKKKCDEKDPFLTYRINSRHLNGKPSYVLKSSRGMAQLAMSMDRDGQGLMSHEYAHVDAMHDRCRDYKTITLWAYHDISRKLVCIAVMDVEQENTENLTIFWNLLNEMLQNLSGKPDYMFNPSGYVADEHHANWRSIYMVFGRSGTDRTVSCEFHFRQSVHRQARRLVNDSTEFIELSSALLEALTIMKFDEACMKLDKLLTRHSHLCSWFNWWMDRKTHIFPAFKPHDASATNLAEVGHSRLASVGRRKMSLLEAAREDVALAIRQNVDLQCCGRERSDISTAKI